LPTAEGTFPKTGGDPPYASEYNKFFYYPVAEGILANIQSSKVSDYLGGTAFDSKTNIYRSFEVGVDDLSEGVVDEYFGVWVAGGNLYDSFGDASIDSTRWANSVTGDATITESGGNITLYMSGGALKTGDATLYTNGANDCGISTGVRYYLFSMSIARGGSSSGSDCTFNIKVTNGTTSVSLGSFFVLAPYAKAWLLKIDATGALASLWIKDAANSWSAQATNVNISAATGTKKPMFFVTSGSTPANGFSIGINKFCYYDSGSNTDSDLITSTVTTPTSCQGVTGFFKHYKKGSVDPVLNVSLDGSNYFVASNRLPYVFASSGTSLKGKLTIGTNGNSTPDEAGFFVVGAR